MCRLKKKKKNERFEGSKIKLKLKPYLEIELFTKI